ncbi:MAG TPA: DUF2505 family protein [Acidimicrobiales bacterium]
MRFSVAQVFATDADRVCAAMASEELYRSMPELPKLSQPEVLARHEDDGTVELLIRYRFDGDLSSAARAVLDPSRLSWVERSVHEVAGRSGSFTMEPDHYGDRFRCTGTFRYDETGEGCVRHIEGDLRVRAPLVAGTVERAIISGLREHLEHQAPAIDALLLP